MTKYFGPVAIKGLPFPADSESTCDIIGKRNENGVGRQYKGYIKPMQNFIFVSRLTDAGSIEDLSYVVDGHIFEAGTQIKRTLIYKVS